MLKPEFYKLGRFWGFPVKVSWNYNWIAPTIVEMEGSMTNKNDSTNGNGETAQWKRGSNS